MKRTKNISVLALIYTIAIASAGLWMSEFVMSEMAMEIYIDNWVLTTIGLLMIGAVELVATQSLWINQKLNKILPLIKSAKTAIAGFNRNSS